MKFTGERGRFTTAIEVFFYSLIDQARKYVISIVHPERSEAQSKDRSPYCLQGASLKAPRFVVESAPLPMSVQT